MNGQAVALIDVASPAGEVIEAQWLARAEAVHRELRPQLPADYAAKMARVFAGGGRMAIAAVGDEVAGVAVYRLVENTCYGLHLYVDDLVTAEVRRSAGIGHALLDHLQSCARRMKCAAMILDSGTQRQRAHAFYFRAGYSIVSFHFSKPLK